VLCVTACNVLQEYDNLYTGFCLILEREQRQREAAEQASSYATTAAATATALPSDTENGTRCYTLTQATALLLRKVVRMLRLCIV
jgi:hypothetical protein